MQNNLLYYYSTYILCIVYCKDKQKKSTPSVLDAANKGHSLVGRAWTGCVYMCSVTPGYPSPGQLSSEDAVRLPATEDDGRGVKRHCVQMQIEGIAFRYPFHFRPYVRLKETVHPSRRSRQQPIQWIPHSRQIHIHIAAPQEVEFQFFDVIIIIIIIPIRIIITAPDNTTAGRDRERQRNWI